MLRWHSPPFTALLTVAMDIPNAAATSSWVPFKSKASFKIALFNFTMIILLQGSSFYVKNYYGLFLTILQVVAIL